MGAKSSKSKSNGSRYSSALGGGESRYRSEREVNEESRARRVGMLCRWISECRLDTEMADLLKQLRELCGELSAKLFERTELQEALATDAEKVIYVTVKAMTQFPESDAITISGLEILKLLLLAEIRDRRGMSQYIEEVAKVLNQTLNKNGENKTPSYSAEDLEKLMLCAEIFEGLVQIPDLNLERERYCPSFALLFRSLSKLARVEYRIVGFLVSEQLLDKSDDKDLLLEMSKLMVESGLTLCEVVKPRWVASPDRVSPLLECILENKLLDVNAPCAKSGRTPLTCALETGSSATLTCLLEHGADVHGRDKYNFTPLMVAIRLGRVEIVQILLGHGARLDDCDDDCNNALHLAVTVNNRVIIEELLKACDENSQPQLLESQNTQGMTPFLKAVWESGKDEEFTIRVLELLKSHGVNVNACTTHGAHALILAVHRRRSLRIIQKLVDLGCSKELTCQGLRAYDVAVEESASEDELNLLRV